MAQQVLNKYTYGEVRETAKSNASSIISAHFEKMRENLNLSEIRVGEVAVVRNNEMYTSIASKVVTEACVSRFGTVESVDHAIDGIERTPHHRVASVHRGHPSVPSHIVPKSHEKVSKSRTGSPSKGSPQQYHFHDARRATPQQMRKELYLHHDLFLSSQDADVEHLVMTHMHPHAANHPEKDYRGAQMDRLHRTALPAVPSHVVAALPAKATPSSAPTRARSPSPSKGHSPQQVRTDLHLRHDMFLTSQDEDVLAVQEQRRRSRSPARSARASPAQLSAGSSLQTTPPAPRTPNPNVSFPERPNLQRTLGSSNSLKGEEGAGAAAAASPMHTFRGVRSLSSEKLKAELHLHHDLFLSSQDDMVVQAIQSISKRRQEADSRYPHPEDELLDYSLKPDVKGARRTVPSHVVRPRPTTASVLRERRHSAAGKLTSLRGGRSLSPTARRHGRPGAQQTAELSAEAKHGAVNTHKSPSSAKKAGDKVEVVGAAAQALAVAVTPQPQASAGATNSGEGGSSGSLKGPRKDLVIKSEGPGSSVADLRGISPNTVTAVPETPSGGQRRGVSPPKKRFDFPPAAPAPATAASTPASAAAVKVPIQLASPAASSATKASSPQQQQAAPHYCYERPLTAAEHAAALALNCKLTAANLAYHREVGPAVPVQRGMSRALSQLVYSVRPDQQ